MVAIENNTARRRNIAIAAAIALLTVIIWLMSPFAGPPHIVLITLDTLRRDHVSVYGSADLTPNIAAFAASATVYDNHYTTANLTLPAHASIFTGLYPSEHGVTDNLTGLPEDATTLAEQLKARGFETAAFVSALHLSPEHSGFGQGFDHYAAPDAPQRRAQETIALTLAWLAARDADRPVFLWVHLFDPHLPYDAPTAASEQLPVPIENSFGDVLSERRKWLDQWGLDPDSIPDGWAERVTELGLDRLRTELASAESFHRRWLPDLNPDNAMAHYASEVAYVDDQLGLLLKILTPDIDRTLMVVTADHGESLGEEGIFYEHNPGLHPPVTLAPLVVRLPNASGPTSRVKELTSHVDLLSMILSATTGSMVSPVSPDRVVFAESERGKSVMATDGAHLVIGQPDATAGGADFTSADLLAIFRGHPTRTTPRCFGQGDECRWLESSLTEFRRARPVADRNDAERLERIKALRALGYVH